MRHVKRNKRNIDLMYCLQKALYNQLSYNYDPTMKSNKKNY